jgi:hypothetical protein
MNGLKGRRNQSHQTRTVHLGKHIRLDPFGIDINMCKTLNRGSHMRSCILKKLCVEMGLYDLYGSVKLTCSSIWLNVNVSNDYKDMLVTQTGESQNGILKRHRAMIGRPHKSATYCASRLQTYPRQAPRRLQDMMNHDFNLSIRNAVSTWFQTSMPTYMNLPMLCAHLHSFSITHVMFN